MATVNLTAGNAVENSRDSNTFAVTVTVNVLAAQNAKGSTLATGDVLQLLTVPTGYAVDFVGINVTTAVTGASVFTVSLGDGSTTALWTSAHAATATGAGDASTAGAVSFNFVAAGGTINATLGTVTGTPTGGVFTVTATLTRVVPATNSGTPTF